VQAPVWNDPDLNAGTMIRAGLWLLQEVGEGNAFTKEQLRKAFPGVSQIDRRVRDLRSWGWEILSNTEDASLLAEDQRFVRAGCAVWDPKERREYSAGQGKAPTAKERQAAFARDDYQCTVCGIAGGEPYLEDSSQVAVLSATRRETALPDGRTSTLLVTECKRCRSGTPEDATGSAAEVLSEIRALDGSEQRRISRWMERGRRGTTPLERAWNAYRRLPAEARDAVRDGLVNPR
jgi:hypothetical protein